MNDLNKLIDICHANLKNSKKCTEYLTTTRKLSIDTINKYNIGYFPQNINALKQYVPDTTLIRTSIMAYNGTSQFSETYHLIFPIMSEYNDAVGIGGRTLLSDIERKALDLEKYKNSSFQKSNYLYGLNKSRGFILKKQNVFVVEGYFDHLAMDNNKIYNSVAICGTSFSKNHLLKLARYTDKITFILDRDDAGKKSMERIYNKYCNQGIKLRFLLLPENCKDIDDYFNNGGSKENFSLDLKQYIPNW